MLLCLTASHKNASFDLLEKLSVGTADVAKRLVAESDFVQGAVVLATCNRFEAYLDIDEPLTAGVSLAVEQAAEEFGGAAGTDVGELRDSLTVLCGDTVADHLFSVSSGLESVVVGEDESEEESELFGENRRGGILALILIAAAIAIGVYIVLDDEEDEEPASP